MSDLNDLIATNAIHSFNSGLRTGIAQERERIIELLETNATGDYKQVMLTPKLILEIKGEQK